jgi:GWxTD domain-containing protein
MASRPHRDRRWRRAGLLTLVAAGCAGSGALAGDSDLEGWARGPVRYIAEKREIELYKLLEENGDRALFVERFWARRDPTPQTMTNEYRELFWERVRYANERFLDSPRPGWQTDRGKIYILYGPPTEIEDYHSLRPGGDLQAGEGVLRWVYQGRPGGRTDLNPVVYVPFQRSPSGEYYVSTDPKLASPFFDALTVREETPMQRVAQQFLGDLQGYPSQLSVMLDLGKMQEVPPHARVILEAVESVERYRTRPVDVAVTRFRHPGEPGGLVLLTLDLSRESREVEPAVIARFRPHDATRRERVLGEDAFAITEVGARRFAQGRLVLDPGEYDMTVLVVDPLEPRPGIHREPLRVAGEVAGLGFSDIVFAAEIASLRFASLASYDEPFHVGPFRVVPSVVRAFQPGDGVNLFYEVYGGEPPYAVSYTLEGLDLDGTWKQLGRPFETEQAGGAQAWELTTAPSWPPGEYRIRIEVADRNGATIRTEAPFRLDPTASASTVGASTATGGAD